MSNAVVSAFKNKQLRKKLLFTTLILIVVRFGSQLPIPEIDSAQISAYLKSTLGDSFSLLNSFTGGSFMQMSVFALSVTPYITSSIIMQLMTIVIPALEEMQKDGEDGRKRMAKITRYVTVVLAIIEGAGLAIGFANQGALGTDYTTFTIVTMIIALTAGAVLVMWLGERITESGIGNGISDIGTGISGTARDMTSGTSTNNGSYTATRTSTPATFAGMNANTWAWLIVAVFGAIIIGFVWFYGQQHQTEEFHSQDQ